MIRLEDYIRDNYQTKTAFGLAVNRPRQAVNGWLKSGKYFIIEDGEEIKLVREVPLN